MLGPGLLESAYEACLAWEMTERGMSVRRQVELPVHDKGVLVDVGYRLDLLVDDAVVVELKTVRAFEAIHSAQLLSYLKLSGHRVGPSRMGFVAWRSDPSVTSVTSVV